MPQKLQVILRRVQTTASIFIVTATLQIHIAAIFISPGRNFFGHNEKPADTHPTVAVKEVECVAGKGLFDDRFFGFKENYKGQVTFLAAEAFDEVCRRLGVNGISAGVTRRNVITRGVDLSSLIGKKFVIQGIEFEGVCECSLCHWMNHAIGEGAAALLHHRGGLQARILSDGVLRVNGEEAPSRTNKTHDATDGALR